MKLEGQKIDLMETRLKTVEEKVGSLTVEVAELRDEIGKSTVKSVELEEKVDVLTSTVNDLKNKFQSETDSLRRIVDDRLSSEQDLSTGKHLTLDHDGDPDKTADAVVLGELCWQVQSLIYQKVLPEYFDDKESYKIKYMEEEIAALEDEQRRVSAERIWTELKTELKWPGTRPITRTMKSLQEGRNISDHPKLNEHLLIQAATRMLHSGIFGSPTYERIMDLISMWKKLVEMQWITTCT